jgi:hypothetical protein
MTRFVAPPVPAPLAFHIVTLLAIASQERLDRSLGGRHG